MINAAKSTNSLQGVTVLRCEVTSQTSCGLTFNMSRCNSYSVNHTNRLVRLAQLTIGCRIVGCVLKMANLTYTNLGTMFVIPTSAPQTMQLRQREASRLQSTLVNRNFLLQEVSRQEKTEKED
jgi:hypothetical protein